MQVGDEVVTSWRNISASDSRSEGYVFKSHQGSSVHSDEISKYGKDYVGFFLHGYLSLDYMLLFHTVYLHVVVLSFNLHWYLQP